MLQKNKENSNYNRFLKKKFITKLIKSYYNRWRYFTYVEINETFQAIILMIFHKYWSFVNLKFNNNKFNTIKTY